MCLPPETRLLAIPVVGGEQGPVLPVFAGLQFGGEAGHAVFVEDLAVGNPQDAAFGFHERHSPGSGFAVCRGPGGKGPIRGVQPVAGSAFSPEFGAEAQVCGLIAEFGKRQVQAAGFRSQYRRG